MRCGEAVLGGKDGRGRWRARGARGAWGGKGRGELWVGIEPGGARRGTRVVHAQLAEASRLAETQAHARDRGAPESLSRHFRPPRPTRVGTGQYALVLLRIDRLQEQSNETLRIHRSLAANAESLAKIADAPPPPHAPRPGLPASHPRPVLPHTRHPSPPRWRWPAYVTISPGACQAVLVATLYLPTQPLR